MTRWSFDEQRAEDFRRCVPELAAAGLLPAGAIIRVEGAAGGPARALDAVAGVDCLIDVGGRLHGVAARVQYLGGLARRGTGPFAAFTLRPARPGGRPAELDLRAAALWVPDSGLPAHLQPGAAPIVPSSAAHVWFDQPNGSVCWAATAPERQLCSWVLLGVEGVDFDTRPGPDRRFVVVWADRLARRLGNHRDPVPGLVAQKHFAGPRPHGWDGRLRPTGRLGVDLLHPDVAGEVADGLGDLLDAARERCARLLAAAASASTLTAEERP